MRSFLTLHHVSRPINVFNRMSIIHKCSNYLKSVSNIEDRRKITKLGLGCSKLNGHRFRGKNVVQTCQSCNIIEDSNHFILVCKDYTDIREFFFREVYKDFPILLHKIHHFPYHI